MRPYDFDGKPVPRGDLVKVFASNLDNGLPEWLKLNSGASFTQNSYASGGGLIITSDTSGLIELTGPEFVLGDLVGMEMDFVISGGATDDVRVRFGFFSANSGVMVNQTNEGSGCYIMGVQSTGATTATAVDYEIGGGTKRFHPGVNYCPQTREFYVGDGDQVSGFKIMSTTDFSANAPVKPTIQFQSSAVIQRVVHKINLSLYWL